MCGIAGTSKLDRYTRTMLPFLAYEMQERGDDSWGISNGVGTVRTLGPITKSYRIPHTFRPDDAVVIHTRTASVGKVTIENQHPFLVYGTEKTILGVHNGGVPNHKKLAEYAEAKLGKKFEYEVDSHALYMYLACGGPPKDVTGTGALVWWEWVENNQDPKQLCLLRFNTEALHVVKLTNGALVWCSTKNPLEKAANMAGVEIVHHYDIKGDNLYKVINEMPLDTPLTSGFPLVDGGRMVFGATQTYTYTDHGRSYSSRGTSWWDNENEDTPKTSCAWVGNNLSVTKSAESCKVTDVFDYKYESDLCEIVYGSRHQVVGKPVKCPVCKETYKDSRPGGRVTYSASKYICANCISDMYLELIDGLRTQARVPQIIGVNVSYEDMPLEQQNLIGTTDPAVEALRKIEESLTTNATSKTSENTQAATSPTNSEADSGTGTPGNSTGSPTNQGSSIGEPGATISEDNLAELYYG